MNIAIVYGHVSRNHGDNAITQGIVHALQRTVPEARIRLLCSSRGSAKKPFMQTLRTYESQGNNLDIALYDQNWPSDTNELGADATPARLQQLIAEDPASVLEHFQLTDCDVVLYNSSEHLYSYNAGDDAAMIKRLAPIMAAHAAGKAVICLPCTFGPFETEYSRSLFRTFVDACVGGAARDAHSLDQLRQSGEPTSNAFETSEVMLDAAFLRDYPDDGPVDENIIGLVPRLDGFGLRAGRKKSREVLDAAIESGFEQSRAFQVYANAAYIISCLGKTCRFLIQNPNDQPLAEAVVRAVRSRCGSRGRCEILGAASIEEYVENVAACSAIVSSRFHSHIFAYSMGVPAVGVYFPEQGLKIPGLMQAFDQSRYCLNGHTATLVDVTNALTALVSQRSSESATIRTLVAEKRRRFESTLESWIGVRV